MGKTKYQVSWQTEFHGLAEWPVIHNLHTAVCVKPFKIDN